MPRMIRHTGAVGLAIAIVIGLKGLLALALGVRPNPIALAIACILYVLGVGLWLLSVARSHT